MERWNKESKNLQRGIWQPNKEFRETYGYFKQTLWITEDQKDPMCFKSDGSYSRDESMAWDLQLDNKKIATTLWAEIELIREIWSHLRHYSFDQNYQIDTRYVLVTTGYL